MSFTKHVLVLSVSAVLSCAAFADWISDSNENAMLVLRSKASFIPESAAKLGLNEFDGDVIDLGPDYQARETASDQKLIAELQKRTALNQDTRVRDDLQILIQYLEDEIESRRIDNEYLLPYHNIHGFLFSSFSSLLDPRNEKSRYSAALERLRKYNGTAAGYTPITDLAKARSTERFDVTGLLGPYRGQLEADLKNAPNFVAGIKAALEQSGLQGWEKDFALLESQMAAYANWLHEEMLPRARKESRLPAEIYANNLKDFGVRSEPEELIAQGQYAYQLIRNEMKALARQIAEQRGWDDGDLVAVIKMLKREQVSQDQLLAAYKQRLAQIENIIHRENLLNLPKRAVGIRLATPAESAATPASHMSPPQLINNTGEFGEFILVQGSPSLDAGAVMDDWSHESITWVLTTHEARPGHELQYSSMVESGTSLARALFAFNSANAEGWAMYAESIMQPYLPLNAQLFSLYNRLFRAARLFLDPMINTGQLTAAQAEDFLVEQLAMSRPMAKSDADRYAFREPGQATSYYYGYMNLMRLRTEIEMALGEKFNQREFHDFIVEQGFLPPDQLRRAVMEKFGPNSTQSKL